MPDYTFTGYNSVLKDRAKELRRNMTKQEKHLWYDYLRNYPIKFYRQRTIENYIVDFYCSKAHLVIELDGSQHYTTEAEQYDAERTKKLEAYGLYVLRFSNYDVDRHFESVCETIDRMVNRILCLLKEENQ